MSKLAEYEKLIIEYIDEDNGGDIPINLSFIYGLSEAVKILKNRNGKAIEMIEPPDNTNDGEQFRYI
tara:strand:- start:904 stop:1104 length:201 start_codon:yes stop_codon:yes gene_type:complete